MLIYKKLLYVVIFTAYISHVLSSTCHPFQTNFSPMQVINYSSDSSLNYCKITKDACCNINQLFNYQKYIHTSGMNIYDENSKSIITSNYCNTISRGLVCFYGCSPNINTSYDAINNKFYPLMSYNYILNFTKFCTNSQWCGTWNNSFRNRTNSCYIMRNGNIQIISDPLLSHVQLSPRIFAIRVLQISITNTIEPQLF